MGALSKVVKKTSEAKVVVRAAVKEPAKPAPVAVAAILEWDDGWDDPHSNFTSNETCIYCKEAPHAKRDFHWIGNPDRLDGKIFGGYHQDCYYNWDKKSRIAANKVPATERPGMDDGSCSGFKRAEPKRGRIPPDALCECGQPYNMHGTGAGDIDEIEIVNEPEKKPATVAVKAPASAVVKKSVPLDCGRKHPQPHCVCVECSKAPAKPATPPVVSKAPKPEVKPAAAPKAPQTAPKTAPKPSQAPASPAKGPPSKEERIATCKANPKAEHKFIAVSVGKPAKTAICLGCGKEWQDNVHTKG